MKIIQNPHSEFDKSQICHYGQISLQSAAVNCSFSDNLTPLGGGNIYFAGDGTLASIWFCPRRIRGGSLLIKVSLQLNCQDLPL